MAKSNGKSVKVPSEKGKSSAPAISQKDLPRIPINECYDLIKAIHENAGTGSISNEGIASLLGTSPTTTKTRYAIWAAEAYGLIYKNEKGEYELSETGRKITAPTYPNEDIEAIKKAVLTPNLLSKFFQEYNGYPIPQETFLINKLETKFGIPKDRIDEAKRVILQNAKAASLIQISDKDQKEYINIDAYIPQKPEGLSMAESAGTEIADIDIALEPKSEEMSSICFVICPIGDEESIERKHSDMMLKHLIEPTLSEFGLSAIRSDKIEKTGLITQQILNHIAKAKLCIVDLSFNNPNVFYELGVRHTCLLPSIKIIRKGDRIPFDVSQGRTIKIDTSDPYTMIDRIESAKKELKEYIKAVMSNQKEISDDNPIKIYLPNLKVTIN